MAAVAGVPVLLGAAALRRDLRVGLRQRLGLLSPPGRGRTWVHGSSVGEAVAALRLAGALSEAGHEVFASASTPTGREVLRRAAPGLPSSLAPLDHPWCVETALARVEPELLVFVETELWPCWIAAAKRRGIPVVIASGRLSDRSFPRYRGARRLLGPTLRRIDAVGARTELDAARFRELGVPADRIRVTGDLKLEPNRIGAPLAEDLARALAEVPIFVAGSTHAGEEEHAHRALAACEAASVPAALVVAPRHVRRADQVERDLVRAGRVVRRRSRLGSAPLAANEVLLLDTIGELGALYAAAAVAFVGGSLAPVGGHNLVEPVTAGCPVVFGPHVENVRLQAKLVIESGAGRQVADGGQLAAAVVDLLRDPDSRRAGVARGRRAIALHAGAVDRTCALVDAVLHGQPISEVGSARDGCSGPGR